MEGSDEWRAEKEIKITQRRRERRGFAEKGEARGQPRMAVARVRKECVAPTALDEFFLLYPALAGWANSCRASGAQERKPPGENA
jgi:hypothetical protein